MPLGVAVAAAPAVFLTAGGWIDEEAIRFWVAAIMARDVPGYATENLTFFYPQLWFYLFVLFEAIGWSSLLIVLPPLATTVGGLLLVDWYTKLRGGGWPPVTALLAVGSLLLHPFSLWVFSRAGADLLALGAFTLAATTLRRLVTAYTVHDLVLLALVSCGWLLVDARFAYCSLPLLPLVALLLPRAMLREAPFGLFLVLCLPCIVVLGLLLWLGWAAAGDPFAVLAALDATPERVELARPGPWLERFGGRWLEPAIVGFVLVAATTPATLLVSVRLASDRRRVAILLVGLVAVPIAGLAVATGLGRAEHPLVFLFLVIVPTVLALAELATARSRRMAFGLLFLGGAMGWWWIGQTNDPDIVNWRAALLQRSTIEPYAAERALAAFLDDGPVTLLDDRLGAPVIAALGRADRFVLPPDPAFFEQILKRRPSVARIAVPDPTRPGADADRLLRSFPAIWSRGPPGEGWRLVYDRSGWRVWCRENSSEAGCGDTPSSRPDVTRAEAPSRPSRPPWRSERATANEFVGTRWRTSRL